MITVKSYNYRPQDAVNIRLQVFCDEQGFKEELDSIDNIAIHFLAFSDDTPIGTCRIFIDSQTKRWTLGRIAVTKEFRKQGIGSLLISAAEEKVKEEKGSSLWLHAQKRAIPFYEKCGYQTFGDFEPDEGYPHIWMHKEF
ncbi:MAG: GNAT family N-acetyltransferase [Bacilli bacterium]